MTNPLLSPSTLPYGLPPFADIEDAHYAEAVEAGLAEHLAEIQAIVADPEPATFENTALAMERSGQLLQRAAASFFTLVSADASEPIRELETRLSPAFSAHQDAVYLNRGLFERFAAIDTDRLDAESARLVEEYLKEFRQSGIQLDEAGQERLKAINAELSTARHRIRPARQGRHEVRVPAAGRRRRARRPARGRHRQRRRGRPHRRARGQVPAHPDPAQQPARPGRAGEPRGPPAALRGLDRPRQRRRQPRRAGPGQGHGPAARREGRPARLRQLSPNSAWTSRRPRTSRPCRPC